MQALRAFIPKNKDLQITLQNNDRTMDLINWTKYPDPNDIDQKELDILLNLIQ